METHQSLLGIGVISPNIVSVPALVHGHGFWVMAKSQAVIRVQGDAGKGHIHESP